MPMKCRSEKTLERAALSLLALGIDLRDARFACLPVEDERLQDPRLNQRLSVDRPGDSNSPALRDLLEHSIDCVRCRELLGLFQATRIGLEEELAGGEEAVRERPPEAAAKTKAGRVMELRSIEPLRRSASVSEGDAPEYRVAADTGPEGEKGEIASEPPVLSLESVDGRYVVRIFTQEPGPGAVAVLLHSEPQDVSRGGEKAPKLFLQMGDEQYPFAEDGTARLPRFPADRIALVVE